MVIGYVIQDTLINRSERKSEITEMIMNEKGKGTEWLAVAEGTWTSYKV